MLPNTWKHSYKKGDVYLEGNFKGIEICKEGIIGAWGTFS